MFELVTTHSVPRSRSPYSPALRAGDLIFVSGQTAWHPVNDPGSVEEQTRETLRRIESLLVGAGADRSCIARTTVYLANTGDFSHMNRVYSEFFTDPYPARTTVGAKLIGVDVEIDAIAVLSGRGSGRKEGKEKWSET